MQGISSVPAVTRTVNLRPSAQAQQSQSQLISEKQAVTPVAKIPPVTRESNMVVEAEMPTMKPGADAQETAVRERIAAFEEKQLQTQLTEAKGNLQEADLEILKDASQLPQENEEEQQISGEKPIECECCKNRKYKDGSHDGSVSYQTPTHISPETSTGKVMAHEQEHVVNEQKYAERDGREVLSQSVTLDSDICPECGTSYTSGGMTTTVTAEKSDPKPVENKFNLSEQQLGKMMNIVAS